MSENYNDDEIIDSSEDTEKKRNKSEKFCFLCRRPESKAGPMIELPNNIHVCTDCMQKSFNSMNQQFNEGKFNYSDLLNMPNVSMIDLGSFQNPVQQPKKEKKKKKQEKPVLHHAFIRNWSVSYPGLLVIILNPIMVPVRFILLLLQSLLRKMIKTMLNQISV